MTQPDIIVSNRVGVGYLSTTISDPTDLAIIYRKWIFGDGVILEGSGLATVSHTYYSPGVYNVTLIDRDSYDQITVNKPSFIFVDEYKPISDFIITQSFDSASGDYWKFYFDQELHLIFEDNNFIFRSKDIVAKSNKWLFVEFNRNTEKMMVGSFSFYKKEIDIVKYINYSPIDSSITRTSIANNSSLKLDEIKIWSKSIDNKEYYSQHRGQAGYLDSL
jgi:PKD repeat protein